MLLDRLVASAAGMASALYFLAAALAWYRIARPSALSPQYVRRIILDRAVAWSSLTILFYSTAVIKLGWYQWEDDGIDALRIVAFVAIWVCGVLSIRAITAKHFGYNAVGWFAGLSFAVGLVILIA